MNTLDYILKKWKLETLKDQKLIEIPNTDRLTLTELLAELSFNLGAEIGVERGLYSRELLKANPKLNLFSIDAWTAYKGYREHVSQSKVDMLREDARENLAQFAGRSEMIKGFSTEVAEEFDNNSLDFVYIDGNHEFTHTVDDIAAWSKKVKKGGIVAGHDYTKRKNTEFFMHVIPALHGWAEAYNIRPLFILGRKDKVEGERRDKSRSWFYVKQ